MIPRVSGLLADQCCTKSDFESTAIFDLPITFEDGESTCKVRYMRSHVLLSTTVLPPSGG